MIDNITIIKKIKSICSSDMKTSGIKDRIIKIIQNFIKQNKLTVKNFNTGIWLRSSILYDRIFANSTKKFRKNDMAYFDPKAFAESILNSTTHYAAKSTGIRGYSNSLIYSDIKFILSEFANSALKYGFIISIDKCKKTDNIVIEIIALLYLQNKKIYAK